MPKDKQLDDSTTELCITDPLLDSTEAVVATDAVDSYRSRLLQLAHLMNGQSFTNDSIFLEGIPELHQISQLEHIPRPRNAFIIYRHHQSILFQDAPMTNQQKSKEIAKLWKSELESVREIYHQMAEEEKQMHAEIYPHYQFRRRRKQ